MTSDKQEPKSDFDVLGNYQKNRLLKLKQCLINNRELILQAAAKNFIYATYMQREPVISAFIATYPNIFRTIQNQLYCSIRTTIVDSTLKTGENLTEDDINGKRSIFTGRP